MTYEYKYYDRSSWQQANTGCFPMLAVIVILAVVGCTTVRYVPVETVRTEYKTKTDTFIQKDSVHVKDSVLIQQKGDTVHYHHWHCEHHWHHELSASNDTIILKDSIQVPYPVERKPTKWESFCIEYGKVMIGATLAMAAILLFLLARWLARLRRKVCCS